jgi:hypothetical protein
MMIDSLTPTKSHEWKIRQSVLQSLDAANKLAQVMTAAYDNFWSASPAIMLEILNGNIAHWLDVLQRNTSVGATINAQLDAANLPEFQCRVPVVMPSGYTFQDGQFTYSPPVRIEPAPIENE